MATRFAAKVAIEPSGCWRWTGFIDKAGYGRLREAGRGSPILYAHRVAYGLYRGPIPAGLALDHLCHNRWCCAPTHLEAVTPLVNARRGSSPNVLISVSGRCGRGHDLTPDNVYYRTDRPGRWNCKACRRERRAAARLREGFPARRS
jgi:hypothetical protein